MNNLSHKYCKTLSQGLPYLMVVACLSILLSACGIDKHDKQRWMESGWKTGSLSMSVLMSEDNARRSVRVSFATKDRVITRSSGGTVRIRNADTGDIIKAMNGPFDGLSYKMTSLSLSPDRKSVLFWPHYNSINRSHLYSPLWVNLDDGKSQDLIQISDNWVRQALFSPNSQTIATVAEKKDITVWDSETGDILYNATGTRARYTPEGDRLITSSGRAGRLKTHILNARSGEPTKIDFGKQRVTFSPDYSKVYSSSLIDEKIGNSKRTKEYEIIFIHDALTGELIRSQKIRPRSFGHIAFSPNGRFIALTKGAAFKSKIEIWDLETGNPDVSLTIESSYGGSFKRRKSTFSPDNQSIIVSSGKSLQIWDVETGKLVKELKHHIKPASSFEFSPDGTRLLVQSKFDNGGFFPSAHYTLWDLKNYTFLAKFPSKSKKGDAAQFSPDGKRIVTLNGGKTVDIWDSQTGHRIATLKGHHGKVISVDFSPNSKRIITGGGDRKAMIWDLNE